MIRSVTVLLAGALLFSCSNNDAERTEEARQATGDSSMATHEHHATALTDTTGSSNNAGPMHAAMNKMMLAMKATPLSGDADFDFAQLMKLHHLSAVEMAKLELQTGVDAQMKQLAQSIIRDQTTEIAVFDAVASGTTPTGQSAYGATMLQQMQHTMTPHTDTSTDASFAAMMIPHHEDGVKMAQAYLKEAKNEQLKNVALNIIKTQPKEVAQMRAWLAKQR